MPTASDPDNLTATTRVLERVADEVRSLHKTFNEKKNPDASNIEKGKAMADKCGSRDIANGCWRPWVSIARVVGWL